MSDEPSPKRRIVHKKKKTPRGAARGQLTRRQEIDHVLIEETFPLLLPPYVAVRADEDRHVGEGAYVSTTRHNRRYYGVLIDQAALKAASMLFFQEAAAETELQRKMAAAWKRQRMNMGEEPDDDDTSRKRRWETEEEEERSSPGGKRPRLDDSIPDTAGSMVPRKGQPLPSPIQKFRFVATDDATGGYRVLLATYVDVAAASEDDPELHRAIELACRTGGDFVGPYYYQYEPKSISLQVKGASSTSEQSLSLRMSMGFQHFLQSTCLPNWFPLSNLQVGQQKVLSLLNMKKDNNGNVIWDDSTRPLVDSSSLAQPLIPMVPRSRYRVCVVGGGIAGLSCCLELFRICEKERIDVEVVLVEGRKRFGGRLWTDHETFGDFPVDLGASWIHGIDENPLAELAREAGAEFVTTSEDVKIFLAEMQEIDAKKDENAGKLFDEVLDLAANHCWSNDKSTGQIAPKDQSATRWYASFLNDDRKTRGRKPLTSRPLPHRLSEDVSVDTAMGEVIAKKKRSDFAFLSEEERNMLIWNTKNIEYALGADIKDLSMKFWDIDERHAFEGDHVLLRQGYSVVIDHMYKSLKKRGDRFIPMLNFAVGKLEYSRKTSTQPYINIHPRNRKFVDVADTCCVTSQDGKQRVVCDFVVSAVPLGVLKASVGEANDAKISFQPPLPFIKVDAINAVGFGLVNKVFIQFPFAFWRRNDIVGPNQTQFGNASGINQHIYLFLDVGNTLSPAGKEAPAILMTLISGSDAVASEEMSHGEVVKQIMSTLRTLFSKIDVPNPVASKVTRWGSDKFARGSYTFLPPGSTDEDFETLQSPVNGNGDSILLEHSNSETMRLFFAGEHTTSLFPSMAHGAMLSGTRAAKEVADSMTISVNNDDQDYDRLVPMSMFRYMNPKRECRCCFCHQTGSTPRDGKLLAFKKGSRQILCHTSCAEHSPEIEVFEGKWKGVFPTVDRSRFTECAECHKIGATIVCSNESCELAYHFPCASNLGWNFDESESAFSCPKHKATTLDGETVSTEDNMQSSRPDVLLGDLAASTHVDASHRSEASVIPPIQDVAVVETSEDESDVLPLADNEFPARDPKALTIDIPLAPLDKKYGTNGRRYVARLGRIARETVHDRWNVDFFAIQENSSARILTIASTVPDFLEGGDFVLSVNGIRIGSSELDTLQKFLTLLSQEVEVFVEVRRFCSNPYSVWS